jgi:hypothetical protein
MHDLNDRERATVLAALRYWQDETSPHEGHTCDPEHFDGLAPLDAAEIDALCERLNASKE